MKDCPDGGLSVKGDVVQRGAAAWGIRQNDKSGDPSEPGGCSVERRRVKADRK